MNHAAASARQEIMQYQAKLETARAEKMRLEEETARLAAELDAMRVAGSTRSDSEEELPQPLSKSLHSELTEARRKSVSPCDGYDVAIHRELQNVKTQLIQTWTAYQSSTITRFYNWLT
jgi:chromosome segregation ATPase